MSTTPPNYRDGIAMVRMLQMLEGTHGRALPLDDLAERLEVHRRTVRRYVQALSANCSTEDGDPLVAIQGRGVSARAVLGSRREPTSARLFQYAAMFAASRMLAAGEGSVLSDSADQLAQSLERTFEPRMLPLVHRAQESFVYVPFGPKDYRPGEEVLDAVVQGTVYRRPLELRYRTRAGWEYRCRFEPWTVVLYRDALFIHGLQHGLGAGGGRLLAIDRIQEAKLVRGERFDIPEEYDPEAWFEGQLGLWQDGGEPERVRLAFTEAAARSARERRWPGQVGWTESEDGRSVLELEIPVTPEVLTWVLTWGADAEVLEPPALRDAVRKVLERAMARYGASEGETP